MQPRTGIAAVLAIGIGCAGPSAAQTYNRGENLLVDIPPGFELAHREVDDRIAVEEFIRSDQTLDAWQELITLQVFFELGGTAPAAYLGTLSDLFSGTCPEGQTGPIQRLGEGIYPAALLIATCPNSPRTEGVESFVAYALGGDERLYVLQYAWARVPRAEDFDAARAFFAGARICDTTRADAPCPER